MTETVPDWMYRQSAVIPCREGPDGPEVLLITSRKKKRWVLPKGVVDPGMTPPASAAKEAWEEAGIEGTVDETPLGTYQYDKWGGTCTVQVFAMTAVTEAANWPEAHLRDREWVTVEVARRRLDEDGLKAIIDGLITAGRPCV